jgi:hypothetical protein
MTTDQKTEQRPAPRQGHHAQSIAERPWTGAVREYDLVKEFVVAIVVVGAMVLGLALVFSSPDEKSLTLKAWSRSTPNDFTATATAELAGTSATGGYGPPYNNTPDAAQKFGPIDLQSAAGVRLPVDTAKDFVITPLSSLPTAVLLSNALTQWKAASATQQQAWAGAYADALAVPAADGDPAKVASGDYGPVPMLASSLLSMAQSGALDGSIQGEGGFYNTNYTKSVLFLADGAYLEDHAVADHLGGDQWGMMNETGSYPGQSWMWLYSFWYQIEPFKSSGNADALVWVLMMVLSLGFVLVPFLPGVRSLPRLIPIHRRIWRDFYREQGRTQP